MTPVTSNSTNEVGDERIVIANEAGHDFYIGSRIRLTEFDEDGDAHWRLVGADGDVEGTWWHVNTGDVRDVRDTELPAAADHPFEVGQKVALRDLRYGPTLEVISSFKPGDVVTIASIHSDRSLTSHYVTLEEEPIDEDGASVWNISWFNPINDPTTAQEADMTNTTVQTPAVGDTISTVAEFNALPLGSTLRDRDGWIHTKIADWNEGEGRYTTTFEFEGATGDFYQVFKYRPVVLTVGPAPTPIEEPTKGVERPLIDFSGSSRATARAYAKEAQSRVLKDSSNKVLKAAAAGRKVDAYALNEAVLDAMRSAATRHGQSVGRRQMATKFAHLGHIVQAVLENHANGLPVYDEGPRSPKIAELKREIEHAGEVNQSLTRDLTAQREENRELLRLAEVRDGLLAELQAYKEANDAFKDEVASTLQEAGDELLEQARLNDALASSIAYSLGLLAAVDENGASQVLGYMDALDVELVIEG